MEWLNRASYESNGALRTSRPPPRHRLKIARVSVSIAPGLLTQNRHRRATQHAGGRTGSLLSTG